MITMRVVAPAPAYAARSGWRWAVEPVWQYDADEKHHAPIFE